MKRHKLIWVMVFLIALLFAWRIIASWGMNAPPFRPDQKVLSSLPWNADDEALLYPYANSYAWLSNNTLVFLRRQGNNTFHILKQRVGVGRSAPPERLGILHNLTYSALESVSPNGKWLTMTTVNAADDRECLILSVDSGAVRYRCNNQDIYLHWLADSTHFLNYEYRAQKLNRYSLHSPHPKTIPLSLQLQSVPYFSSQGKYWAGGMVGFGTPQAKLESGAIGGGKSQVVTLSLPAKTKDAELRGVSPDGTRLLWVRMWDETSWFGELRESLTHRGGEPLNHEVWYVTDAHGNNPQTITTYRWRGYRFSHGDQARLTLKWLPDGKHLSAVYEEALYVVPVP
jgi:hypothetical protein